MLLLTSLLMSPCVGLPLHCPLIDKIMNNNTIQHYISAAIIPNPSTLTTEHLKPKVDLYSPDECRIPNNPSSKGFIVLKLGTHLTQLPCLERMEESQALWALRS